MNIMDSHICLCGFMGAGKSAVGYRLATLMRRRFTDLDAYIEQKEGNKIADIFRQKGEEYFRACERTCLSELLSAKTPLIISLGGGALQNPDHVHFIKKNAVLIYLNVNLDILVQRLQKDAKRPLLRNEDGSGKSLPELKKHIETLLNKRKQLYLSGHLIFSPNPKDSIIASAQSLYDQLGQYA